jgi:hypothetical protein
MRDSEAILKDTADQIVRGQQAEGELKFKTLVKDVLHGRIEFCRTELPFRETTRRSQC